MDGLAAWVSQLQFGRLTELLVTVENPGDLRLGGHCRRGGAVHLSP